MVVIMGYILAGDRELPYETADEDRLQSLANFLAPILEFQMPSAYAAETGA